ncbi:MAG: pyrroline-5-carboxylate reductase [Oscillospiraceae bacterium]|nr:pyrroline-5-carboxylate reductase [Oscillospiraceae bacterium]
MKNIGFIGAGNMGTAIIKALTGSRFNIYAFDPDISKTSKLDVTVCKNSTELAENCEIVFLAVKPQVFDSVLKEIAGSVTENTVLVSIAAGIDSKYIRERTRPNAKVILAMPNTPLLLGKGAVALAKSDSVTAEEFAVIDKIFSYCGITGTLPEDKMKHIIAINGSSPAFIYLFAKGFTDYAKENGIDEGTAMRLFCQTLTGSASMLTDSGYSIDSLIEMVSSPGGTTLAGLKKFYDANLTETVRSACEACTERAFELGGKF